MTPAASWSPADYYTASRAARRAWQQTDQQLAFGLEEADAGAVRLLESVAVPLRTPSPRGGLESQTHEGRGANPRQDARRGQKGA